jgi:hypothetical protein
LGNVRARLAVDGKAETVWAHVPWRRHDREPENKDVIIVDAASGKRVLNVLRAGITTAAGDLLFQPTTAPGEYFVYYLPYQTRGEWYFPTTVYVAPTNSAEPAWAESCAPIVERIRRGDAAGVPEARLLEIQSINDFHRFEPMEVTSTGAEKRAFFAQYEDRPYLLFAESRTNAIRMRDELPLHWLQTGPGTNFAGEARRGEFYTFQLGMYAHAQDVEEVLVSFENLIGDQGDVIPATALRCFNLGGTNWLGQRIDQTVTVPKGTVQAFWFGVDVPTNVTAQSFRGTIRLAARNAPATAIAVELRVLDKILADHGDSDVARLSRLRWLDSTIGLDDQVFPPYTPVTRTNRRVALLGRAVRVHDSGLPESIQSSFSRNVDSTNGPVRELLARPIEFVAETAESRVNWTAGSPRFVSETSGAVSWQATSESDALTMVCRAKLECDGYINYHLTLHPRKAAAMKDLRLEIPLRRDVAIYMMGMGRKGGYRPASWEWKWSPDRANNQLWLGDINAGLSCKLKHVEDRWDLMNLKESGPYRDWSNGGEGGCKVTEQGEEVVIRAYTGPVALETGRELQFNFGLLITPVKALDPAHWSWRYFHQGIASPVAEVAKTGASIINLHQGDPLNPYINYPFLTVDKLGSYIRDAHSRNMKVKLYYTIRELSNYTGEFWALRSFGNEVFSDGPGFQLADHFAESRPGQAVLPKTGDSWLCEHVQTAYVPAWHTPLGNGHIDAAIATTGLSRWHNYYLEGLNWLIRNLGVDGLYLDGVGYDREIMKRVRKVMQREGEGTLIDFHSGNNYHPEYGLNNCANQYLELFPYVDSLWFGEGFDYNESPDYWMVEVAGIPYGLFGEMLQGGGNAWRGMLFGMTSRLGWGGTPQAIWKVWDDFGIQQARMSGFWDPSCPVKTGRKDLLATAYIREGRTLISLASWATNLARVRLQMDWPGLGLNSGKAAFYAPPIKGFQPEAKFGLDDEIPVTPGRGWLLLLDEAEHKLTSVADLDTPRSVLLDDLFSTGRLSGDWTTSVSQRENTAVDLSGGAFAIKACANSAAFATRPLPTGTTMVTCSIDPGTDKGATWGPGLALLWPNGKALRVNVRTEGRYGVDDGRTQLLEGLAEQGKPSRISILLQNDEIVVYASQEGAPTQELGRFPRSEFPGEPLSVRVGKMSPAAKAEDFSEPGPEGICTIIRVQCFGRS